MLHFILAFVVAGARVLAPEGLPAAPFDLATGAQTVDLRAALIARTPGTRLVLLVRDPGVSAVGDEPRRQVFERAVPLGAVSARLRTATGKALHFAHTGYRYYRGYAGVVLSEQPAGTAPARYVSLELESTVALDRVRLVWLDARTRRIEDLEAAP